ncbi:hypothetical protein CYY_003196 [Polysphondylium violaceum]|uniref:Uncharacterized protein n=1 Tax=Polysphondylium violaceum TaxID=133409 RepID=A0A8J4Q035_9MYCE|nr:hypothetical protein CYY_003196 [Polysphondylium violaceum]
MGILNILSNFGNPSKSLKKSSISSSLSYSSMNGDNQNSCYYIISIGGPVIYVNDNPPNGVHRIYFGYPPVTATVI